jgi:hypothetical protein
MNEIMHGVVAILGNGDSICGNVITRADGRQETVKAWSRGRWEQWVAYTQRRDQIQDGFVAAIAQWDPQAARLEQRVRDAMRDVGEYLRRKK